MQDATIGIPALQMNALTNLFLMHNVIRNIKLWNIKYTVWGIGFYRIHMCRNAHKS